MHENVVEQRIFILPYADYVLQVCYHKILVQPEKIVEDFGPGKFLDFLKHDNYRKSIFYSF